MNKMLKRLHSIVGITFIALTLCALVRAQNPPSNENNARLSESKTANVEEKDFYQLTKMTPDALADGETDKAKENAQALLKQAELFKKNWNYGNAVHVANLVLGEIAFNSGNLDEAKHFLLEAGKTSGSPQLNSFGPNMLLAKLLLEKGARETVIEYFDLCAKFWSKDFSKLDQWKTAVLNKEMPDFGANLVYQMESMSRSRQVAPQN